MDLKSLKRAGSRFALYRGREGVFYEGSRVWELNQNSIRFWTEMKPFAPELSSFALRIFHTPANSVPSERSFSTRNLIADRKRNCLYADKADILLSYIHVNNQVLVRTEEDVRGWFGLQKQQLLELEDEAVNMGWQLPTIEDFERE